MRNDANEMISSYESSDQLDRVFDDGKMRPLPFPVKLILIDS